MSTAPNPYDQLAYLGQVHSGTSPLNIAVAARLLGVDAPAPETARVLELACGHGINLMWIAQTLPGATCVGIDQAASGIERGNALARLVGLRNIDLRQGDLTDIDASFGNFDYIIAHGVYSWVPEAVRDSILRICEQCLSPHGIGYVSYNAYPGNHLREVGRRLMRIYASHGADPAEKIGRARAILKYFADHAIEDEGKKYYDILQGQHERVEGIPDYLLFHDDLSADNHAVYFADFIEHARRHGLHYLTESDLSDFTSRSGVISRGPQIAELGHDRIEREQFYDIRVGKAFRQTLLTRHALADDVAPRLAAVMRMRLSGDIKAKLESNGDLRSDEALEFRNGRGTTAVSKVPHVKAALAVLGAAWPASIGFDQLATEVRAFLECTADILPDEHMAAAMLHAHASAMIEFSVAPDTWARAAGARPCLHPLALTLAQDGQSIPTLRGRMMALDDGPVRLLVRLLDGTRTVGELYDLMSADVAGRPDAPDGDPREIARNMVDGTLVLLARAACLIT